MLPGGHEADWLAAAAAGPRRRNLVVGAPSAPRWKRTPDVERDYMVDGGFRPMTMVVQGDGLPTRYRSPQRRRGRVDRHRRGCADDRGHRGGRDGRIRLPDRLEELALDADSITRSSRSVQRSDGKPCGAKRPLQTVVECRTRSGPAHLQAWDMLGHGAGLGWTADRGCGLTSAGHRSPGRRTLRCRSLRELSSDSVSSSVCR